MLSALYAIVRLSDGCIIQKRFKLGL